MTAAIGRSRPPNPTKQRHSQMRLLKFTKPAIAFAIREQLYKIAVQNVTSIKEMKISKKARRGPEYASASKSGVAAVDLVKLFGHRSSVIRKRKEWDVYEPIVDILSNEEVEVLEAREDRVAR